MPSVRSPRAVLAALVAILAVGQTTAPAAADRRPARYAIYGGVCGADLGGQREPGVVAGALLGRFALGSGFAFQYSLEYSEEINTGRVQRRSVISGSTVVTFDGPAEVRLRCVRLMPELQYAWMLGGATLRPHAGVGPSLRVDQELRTGELDSSLGHMDWFRQVDVLAGVGIGVDVGWLLVDVTVARGLRTFHAADEDPAGGGDPVLFTDPDGHLSTYRLVAGLTF